MRPDGKSSKASWWWTCRKRSGDDSLIYSLCDELINDEHAEIDQMMIHSFSHFVMC